MVGCPSSEDTAGSALIQFADQRFGCLHVRRVEALREPFDDGTERRARRFPFASCCQQPRETERRSQLERFGSLGAGNVD